MNETLLNGILHLFAVFAAAGRLGHEAAREVVGRYLQQNLGVVDDTVYRELFGEFLTLHDSRSDQDWSWEQARVLAASLRTRLPLADQYLLLARLMELTRLLDLPEKFRDPLGQTAGLLSIPPARFAALFDLVFRPGAANRPEIVIFPAPDSVTTPSGEPFRGRIALLHLPEAATLFLNPLSDGLTVDDIPAPPGTIRLLGAGSVVRAPGGALLHYGELLRGFSVMTSGTRGFVFAGRDVEFSYPGSGNGLHGFTFAERSGRLVGVMGGSGSGKSTLLALLNGSLAPDSGSVTLNGIDIHREPQRLHGVIGYVPQDDLLAEELTVRDNLLLNARLCLAHLPEEEIRRRVDTLLAELGQTGTRDLRVGNPVEKSISGGQRKRLNIALELIREPAILLVDEPTSGLSSADSDTVMNLLKGQADKGKLVIVIIHQPSSEIFRMFDTLWVLDAGGYPVYGGNPLEAIRYFRETANLAGAEQLFCPRCGQVNPEQIFTILEAKTIGPDGRFTGERALPPSFWHRRYRESLPPLPGEPDGDLPPAAVHAPGKLAQTVIFFTRTARARLASRQYLAVTLLEAPLLALLISWICRSSGEDGYRFGDNRNLVIFFFMSVISALFLGLSVSAEEIVRDRKILHRERLLHLSWSSYIAGKFLYLAGVAALQTALYLAVSIPILVIPGMWGTMFAVLFSCALFASALGLNISSAFRTPAAIYILIPILLIPQILLSGVVVRFDDLIPRNCASNHTPVAADLMASRWGVEALVVAQFRDNAYQRPLLDAERDASRAGYLADALIPELRARLDYLSLKTDLPDRRQQSLRNARVIRTGIRELEKKSGMASGMGDEIFTLRQLDRGAAEGIKGYLDRVERLFRERKEAAERSRSALLETVGSGSSPGELRRENQNRVVAALVRNREELDPIRVCGDRLAQLSDPVYQEADSPWGRAVFMAGEKRLGSFTFGTAPFNLGVIAAMTAALLAALRARLLKRLMKLG